MSFSNKHKSKSLFSPQRIVAKSMTSMYSFCAKKCRHFYYRTKESFGQHKRDIVVCRVEEACDSLQDTRSHFEDALEHPEKYDSDPPDPAFVRIIMKAVLGWPGNAAEVESVLRLVVLPEQLAGDLRQAVHGGRTQGDLVADGRREAGPEDGDRAGVEELLHVEQACRFQGVVRAVHVHAPGAVRHELA